MTHRPKYTCVPVPRLKMGGKVGVGVFSFQMHKNGRGEKRREGQAREQGPAEDRAQVSGQCGCKEKEKLRISARDNYEPTR